MASGTQGQTLIEFMFSVMIAVFGVYLGGLVLKAEWQRVRCVYLVFEGTHSRLIGALSSKRSIQIQFSESADRVVGVGTCGKIKEKVELPKLEAAQWN